MGLRQVFTNAAGYCLVASAERDGMRLISVVLGTENDEARMRESQKLLSYGFRNYETKTLFEPGTSLQEQPIYYGEVEALPLGVAEDVIVTFPRVTTKTLMLQSPCLVILRRPSAKEMCWAPSNSNSATKSFTLGMS